MFRDLRGHRSFACTIILGFALLAWLVLLRGRLFHLGFDKGGHRRFLFFQLFDPSQRDTKPFLFRDETAVQYNVFATICRQHNCVLVTADGMIFNFNNPMHLNMFRYLAEMAAEYIPQHVHVLHEMRERKARKGLYAGIGSIPRGYIVDYDKKSPTYNKFIVYWPHGEIVFSLFKRFFEIGGDFSRLCRELHELPFVFPLFDASVDARVISRTHSRKVAGGYCISRQGLLCLLTNPIYIGWWIVKGDIISQDNHERIIDEEHEYLFWYAFNKLAVYTVQGEVNEERTTGQRRYYQKYTAANSGGVKHFPKRAG